MRVGAGVDDDPRAVADVLDHVDQLALAVALAAVDVEPQTVGVGGAARLDVGEGLGPVDRRVALTEQVEVRAVEDGDHRAGHVGLSTRLSRP
jgi:hypothetical protein